MPWRTISAAAAIILLLVATWSIINYRSNDVQIKEDLATSSPGGNSLASSAPIFINQNREQYNASKNALTLANKTSTAKNKFTKNKYTAGRYFYPHANR